jgi:hypothetical protein
MSSYAVLWRGEHTAPMSGRLELDGSRLCLRGGDRSHEVEVEIPYADIVTADRDPAAGIGPCHAIRLQRRGTGPLLLASLGGVGALNEILNAILEALPAARKPPTLARMSPGLLGSAAVVLGRSRRSGLASR